MKNVSIRLLTLVATLFTLLALPPPASAQDPTTATSLDLYATLASVSVVLTYQGDDNANATARIEYRSSGPMVSGHPPVRLSGKRWVGSVLFLEPDTDYEVQLVVDDPDNSAPALLTGMVRTRADAPVVVAGGEFWVDVATGADTNPGTQALPFASIQAAANVAGAGDTVHVLPGVYHEQVRPPQGGVPGAPLRFVAEGAGVALDGSDAAILAGATWTDLGGNLYATPFAGRSIYLAVGDARVYDYQTLADLQAENGNIGQPGVISGGFYVDTAAAQLYLITPGHDDPSAHQVFVATLPSAFLVDTISDVVIEGFEMRYYGVENNYGSIGVDLRDSARCWVRNNYIHHVTEGVRIRRRMASENVIEGNFIRDTSVYVWPWGSVKSHTPSGTGVQVLDGYGNVVRCNQVEGTFNGVSSGNFGVPNDEDYASDTDVYQNQLRFHGDDGLEPEGAQRNVRMWSNVIGDVFNAISISPIGVGPIFFARNLIDGYQDHAVKVNNGTSGWVFLYHTTAVPLPGASYPGAAALQPSLPFGGITSRNNIWEANQYVVEYIPTSLSGPIDWNYDDLYTNDTAGAGRFVKWLNVRYANLGALQAGTGLELDGFAVKPLYEDAANGDFRLVAGHPLLDAGVLIPGINDGFMVGSAPDVGAVERGLTAPGCGGTTITLLRNAEWPAKTKIEIFTGPDASCPPPLDPGCATTGTPGISLDPWGPDCLKGAAPGDDDTYVPGFACGGVDPDPMILGDGNRPLVFYQIDRNPSLCNGLRLVKDGLGSLRIDCR